jgi:hypothetical protein
MISLKTEENLFDAALLVTMIAVAIAWIAIAVVYFV